MTCDEAKERALVFRAALANLVEASTSPEPYDLVRALVGAKTVLEIYPFDPEAFTMLRKLAANGLPTKKP